MMRCLSCLFLTFSRFDSICKCMYLFAGFLTSVVHMEYSVSLNELWYNKYKPMPFGSYVMLCLFFLGGGTKW